MGKKNEQDTCFKRLKRWKEYPNFKAEQRVDWILSMAIPILLEEKFKSRCKLILPEFPLRNGTVNDNNSNRSNKIDYYCLLENEEHYLVELKTDSDSISSNQINYYKKVKEKIVYEILEGLMKIKDKSRSKDKYNSYIKPLIGNKLIIDGNIRVNKNKKFNIVYIVPDKNNKQLNNNVFKSKEFIVFELKDLCNILKKSDNEFLKELGAIVEEWE